MEGLALRENENRLLPDSQDELSQSNFTETSPTQRADAVPPPMSLGKVAGLRARFARKVAHPKGNVRKLETEVGASLQSEVETLAKTGKLLGEENVTTEGDRFSRAPPMRSTQRSPVSNWGWFTPGENETPNNLTAATNDVDATTVVQPIPADQVEIGDDDIIRVDPTHPSTSTNARKSSQQSAKRSHATEGSREAIRRDGSGRVSISQGSLNEEVSAPIYASSLNLLCICLSMRIHLRL
jgi:hypothetical protein